MELVTGLSLSLFGSGHGYSYRKPQPPVVVNILPPPCNCRACRGTEKKKKTIKKKKKLYPEVGRWHPMENDAIRSHARPWLTNDYDRYRLEPRPSLAAATRRNSLYREKQMSATATGARGNNTSTYCRRTRQVYESEEEIDEEESESDDESEESDDEEEEDESDGEETVHQLPAGRGRGSPEEHLRSRRAYY